MPANDSHTGRGDRTTRRTYLAAAGAGGLAAVAGCLGSLGDGGGGTFTVAATIPRTGSFSTLGQDLKRGYELGVERMNRDGGVAGMEVELLAENDESDAETVRETLQQLTSNNDVNMIWGSFSSLLVTAGSAFAEQQGTPFLGIAFASMAPHEKQGYEWTYAPFPKTRDMTRATKNMLGLIPEDERPQRVGIWEPNSSWGNEMATHWEDSLSSAGYDVVLRETFGMGTKDFSTLVSKSQSANVEALLSNPIPPDGITAMKQMKEAGWAPEFVEFIRAADPDAWWSALGEDGAYVTMSPGWVHGMDGNGNADLPSTYYGTYDDAESGSLLPVMVGASYNLTQVAEQAVAAAGSADPSAVQSALRSETFHTVIGDFGFDDNGMPEEGQLAAPSGQWWNGEQRLVYPDVDTDAAIDLKHPMPDWGDR